MNQTFTEKFHAADQQKLASALPDLWSTLAPVVTESIMKNQHARYLMDEDTTEILTDAIQAFAKDWYTSD